MILHSRWGGFIRERGLAVMSVFGNIVGQLRAAGEQIDDVDLARISPLAHRHVIPNGTYFLNQAVHDPND